MARGTPVIPASIMVGLPSRSRVVLLVELDTHRHSLPRVGTADGSSLIEYRDRRRPCGHLLSATSS